MRIDFLLRDQRVHILMFSVSSLFGHRLVHHPCKIPVYLGALVFRNDMVTRCQCAYNLNASNVRTAFGRRSFGFAVPYEWNKLPFEMKLMYHEFDNGKKNYKLLGL